MPAPVLGRPRPLRSQVARIAASRPAVLTAVAILGLSQATPALALGQVKFSASVDSDYRYRGVSRSQSRPALTLGVGYDRPSGVYVGASAITSDTIRAGFKRVGDVEYAGFAWRDATGRSWDIGVNNHHLEVYGATHRTLTYNDVYVGLAKNDLSGHVYYSPNYFAPGVRAAYFDFNATVRRGDAWRLLGHVGLLTPLGGGAPSANPRRDRLDIRAGVARSFSKGEVRLTWTAATPRPKPESTTSRPGLVLGASVYF